MNNNSQNTSDKKNFSQSLKIEKKNPICKDGFCSLPSHNETSKLRDDKNLFDPIK